MADQDELLTVDELADLLKVTRQTIYAWRADRTTGPPAIKVGGNRLRFRRRDVDAWLDARSEKAVTP
jgi:excisionase family DNA binding protein